MPQQLAVFDEDLADVSGQVAEEVADVAVLGDPAARQLRTEVIFRPAAVRMNQSPDEGLRLAVCQLRLPVGENDPAKMLATGPVLGKRHGDTRMRNAHIADAAIGDAKVVGRASGNVRYGRGPDLVHYVHVPAVTREPEFPAVRRWMGDRSVAEVAAEQIAVGVSIRNPPAEMMGTSPRRLLAMAPPADGRVRDTGQHCDPAVARGLRALAPSRVQIRLSSLPYANIGSHMVRTDHVPDRYHRGPPGE